MHHFLPGVGLGFAAGGIGVLSCPPGRACGLGAAYGIGVALTTDELRLLAGRNNAYWGSNRFAFVQCALGSLGCAGLGAVFYLRGQRARKTGSGTTWPETAPAGGAASGPERKREVLRPI